MTSIFESNCSYYKEIISSFLDYYLQPLTKKVELYIKVTNHFLKKLKELGSLLKIGILCTDVVGLYPNIPLEEGLASTKKYLNNSESKEVTTDTLVELADKALKNHCIQFLDKIFKQKWVTTIRTKVTHSYFILFMADLEQRLICDIGLNSYTWWKYIGDIFLKCEHGEESLKLFWEKISSINPTLKFTEDWSYNSVNFLHVKIILKDGKITTDMYVKPRDILFFYLLKLTLVYKIVENNSTNKYH